LRLLFACLAALLALCTAAHAGPTVVDSYYRADVRFPQFDRYWTATSMLPSDRPKDPFGGTVRVYVRNDTDKPLAVKDVLYEDVSLAAALALFPNQKYRGYLEAHSFYWSKLPARQIEKLKKAGWPIWWRFDPRSVKPGEIGELIVRLRYNPPGRSARLKLVTAGGSVLKLIVPTDRVVPHFEDISFAPGRQTAYLYVQSPKPGAKPARVLMDGRDITCGATISADPKASVAPVVCRLAAPVENASVHTFQAVYADGSKATSMVRAWDEEFCYGMWGARRLKDAPPEAVVEHIRDFAQHNINVQMGMVGSDAVRTYMKTDEGLALLKSLGMRRMVSEPTEGRFPDPRFYFIADEPDAGDYHVKQLPNGAVRVGTLAQGVAKRTQDLHAVNPFTQCLVNMDFTYRPYNYYIYGQAPDVLASDPYYQARLNQEAGYGKTPEKLNAFKKATYIEGVAAICHSSQAPKPTHILLLGGAGRDIPGTNKSFYVPPTEKRIEAYYAIGAGTKGLSYWWFHGLAPGLEPGKVDPMAAAQWKDIGLVGAELRTVGPLIVTSCPATIPIKTTPGLWVRTLLRGQDSLVLVCVNDTYNCDMQGINIKPLQGVEVNVDLPSWLKSPTAFEVTSAGTKDLTAGFSAGKANLNLGTVEVTRLIVITSDPSLRASLQKYYDEKLAANVAKLGAEMQIAK
jgi:hypothetical protein